MELPEVKMILKSLLTSTSKEMNLQELNNDYKKLEGRPIPFRDLGFDSLEHLIRSISDSVEIFGTGMYATVRPVINNNSLSNEINRLVMLQKDSSKRPNNRKFNKRQLRRPNCRYRHNVQTQNSYYENYNYFDTRKTPQKEYKKENQEYKKPLGAIPKTPQWDDVTPSKSIDFKPVEFTSCKEDDTELTSDSCAELYYSEDDCDNFSEVNTTFYRVPGEIQTNLTLLFKSHPEGIWCGKLPDIYKKTYGSELNYLNFGFHSVAQMCSHISHICNIVQPATGDFKVYHISIPKPISREEIKSQSKNQSSIKVMENSKSDALPYVDDLVDTMLQNYYPPDTVKLFEELDREWVPDCKPMEFLEIIVSEIYDPSKFWFILLDEKHFASLHSMMDEMQSFYMRHGTELKVMKANLIRLGLYCAALYKGEYTRAIVVNTLKEKPGYVKVFYIDYGTVSTVSHHEIFFLHRKFFHLSAQAIRARLAGILPPKTNMPWSRRSCELFFGMSSQKGLVAQIVRVNHEKKILDLYLCDTSTKDDIYIADCIVKAGEAIFMSQEQERYEPVCMPIVNYIHLYPTFDELEQALVPTVEDMNVFLSRGIDHFSILPKYYHNPVYKRNWADDIDELNKLQELSLTDLKAENEKYLLSDTSSSTLEYNKTQPSVDTLRVSSTETSECSFVSCEEYVQNSSSLINSFPPTSSTYENSLASNDDLSSRTLSPPQPTIPSSETAFPSYENLSEHIQLPQFVPSDVSCSTPKISLITPPPGFHCHPSQMNNSVYSAVPYTTSNFINNQHYPVTNSIASYQQNQAIYNMMQWELLRNSCNHSGNPASVFNPVQSMPVPLNNPLVFNPIASSLTAMNYMNAAVSLEQLYKQCVLNNIYATNNTPFPIMNNSVNMAPTLNPNPLFNTYPATVSEGSEPIMSVNSPKITTLNTTETLVETDHSQTENAVIQDKSHGALQNEVINCIPKADVETFHEKTQTVPCNVEQKKSLVSKQELADKLIHFIHLNEKVYVLVSEVIQQFMGENMSIIEIRRKLALKNHSVPIIDINLNNESTLKQELLRLNIIEDNVDFIHITPASSIQKFLSAILNIDIELKDFNYFL